MKPEELRIGNWYQSKGYESQVEPDNYMNWEVNGCWAEGVPLTSEWLEKFGFRDNYECDDGVFGWILKGFIYINEGQIRYEFHGHMLLNREAEIKHVHQLQNLYFALTGKELNEKTNN